ncbi:MAG TPA: hypothetical protein DIU39_07780 [Flavobacteriales bacterium]|nr:hypothetical protein [Flavobacteriales bacterium]|tara:strand:- start:39345 stop:39941 length:597 start_codon:yes stop_codon:yes gene_type:complete
MTDFKGTIIINKESLDNKFNNGRYEFFLYAIKKHFSCVKRNLQNSEEYKYELMEAYIDKDNEALLRLVRDAPGVYDQFYNEERKIYQQEKYSGSDGMYKFANDYPLFSQIAFFPFSEDDYLFAFHCMGYFTPYIEEFIAMGLHYDNENQTSTDFVITSFGQPAWETPWLEANSMFAWHKNDPNKWSEEHEKEFMKWYF